MLLKPHTSLTDSELLDLLGKKDENALSAIIDRYWDPLFTKAFNFLSKKDIAKDCVQDVFISLWKRSDKPIDNLNHYLHQAVRFRALRTIKDQQSNKLLESRLSKFNELILNDESLEFKELKKTLYSLIHSLPGDQRTIFLLNREEGLTYKQIAEKLNISVKTVEKKMSRSIKTLRTGLDEAMILAIGSVSTGVFSYFLPLTKGLSENIK